MKIGTETGSLTNAILAGHVGQPEPEVGMGITVLSWTDRAAGTIRRVSASGNTLWFTYDHAERTDQNGMSESQTYTYTDQPDSPQDKATRRKDGVWKLSGSSRTVRLGSRNTYHDFSF